ncbi:hypothetical protein E2320_021503, partial [Naja naja]
DEMPLKRAQRFLGMLIPKPEVLIMDNMIMTTSSPEDTSSASLNVLMYLDTLANSTEEQCFSARSRSTVLQGLPFGGVPTVLALNFLLWMVLLFIFSCLRKAAWDYGRLALLMDNDSRLPPSTWNSYDLTSLFYGEQSEKEKSPSESSPLDADNKDVGFCSWLLSIYQMKDEEIQSKCGIDATTYLSFQRHLLVLLLIVCVLSVAVILPVNFSGKNPANFGRTTIANVPKDDRLLWLHTGPDIDGYQDSQRDHRYISCYQTLPAQGNEREALLHNEGPKGGKIMIKIHPCSRIFCCRICGFEEVDAEQYYGELEEKLTDEFNAERSRIALKRLDMAFVTFQDERMTAIILKDYSRIRCRKHPQQSSVTTVVKSHCWGVGYAPAPNDIIWENLSIGGALWWVKFILLNICLFILLFFLTTPAIIVNTMDMFNVTRPVETLKNPIVTQFFPTLLLWAFSVFLPFIVYYSAFFESHWTRSSENQITMHKCYFFLVFMVIILPSLGLTSLDLFFRWLFDTHFVDQAEIKFQCVFLPDNGAFFVNYVVTSSLIGTAMELLRIPGLIVYATRLCFAKSEPERLHIKRYAWTCCIFAVVMTYSITCPIIVPFGLLYMLLKHMVDRYNIYYVYIPTRLNHRIHLAAVNQVVTAPILCMFWLLFFSILRLGSVRPITIFTCVVLLSCIPFSFFGLCLKKFHPRKPSSYQMSEQSDGAFNDTETSSISSTPNSNMFVATVLQEPELSLTPAASPAHQSYGTMGSHLDQAENIEEGGLPNFEAELENTEGKYRTGPLLDTQTHYH